MRRCIPGSLCTLALAVAAGAQGFHQRDPNRYGKAAAENAATTLNRRVAAGDAALEAAGTSGRLRALLRELHVPETSQTLVFSKTSLQRHRVSPHNPRALYFGPDAYVGWAPGAAALEIAVGDPRLGLVFYTLPQESDAPPLLQRDDSCLSCHASARTDGEPGLLLRSVFPDETGDPIASAGEAEVTSSSPMAERWGGWLVTGQFAGEHRGNGIAERDERGQWRVHGRVAADLRAFACDFDVDTYLVPTSDVGALLALEQQVTVHNLLIRAALQMRCLLDGDRIMNQMLGETGLREPTARIADARAKAIVAALLMVDEAPLAGRDAAPDPAFATDFAGLWPQDQSSNCIGRLDLGARLFTLPLSPMVHAPAFAALPGELRQRVLARLRLALDKGKMPGSGALTRGQRTAMHAHLQATLPDY